MDMARPYIEAVKEELPDIDIVFDRFHIMKHVNEAVDTVRKRLSKSLDDKGRRSMKRSRFLMLRNQGSLSNREESRLNEILAQHEPLMIMHMMKEELRRLWTMRSVEEANSFLVNWCLDAIVIEAQHSGHWEPVVLAPLKNLAKFMLRHRSGILSYFKHFISNGKAEGINNKIKTLKRQTYGIRDTEYFQLRLYHLHRQKHRISG